MGTRSLTFVYDGERVPENLILCMYRQMDGYPEGHGQELLDFLKPLRLVNGLKFGDNGSVANGMGCLAAQLIRYFKEEPGGFYLQPPKTDVNSGQDYEYHVYRGGKFDGAFGGDQGEPYVLIYEVSYEQVKTVLFDGPVRGRRSLATFLKKLTAKEA